MEKGLLVVSFGTSFPETRKKNLDAMEHALSQAFPERKLYRAYTSTMVIRHIEKAEGIRVPTPDEALTQAAADGIRDLAVQPTHFMPGLEYEKLLRAVAKYSGWFDRVTVGKPLVSDKGDISALAEILIREFSPMLSLKTVVCLMGHGTESPVNQVYTQLQTELEGKGFSQIRIGTVEAQPGIDTLLRYVRENGCEKVILAPLMMVAGDHANNDMAGEDGWASQFAGKGAETVCILRGLGENPAVRQRLAEHLKSALLEN